MARNDNVYCRPHRRQHKEQPGRSRRQLPASARRQLTARELVLSYEGEDSYLRWARAQARQVPNWLPSLEDTTKILNQLG